MSRWILSRVCVAVGAALALGACEEHSASTVKGSPEYLHEALSGDLAAEAQLAACFDAGGGCPDISPNPAMACAWRGVRLASRAANLSLADEEAYARACANPAASFRQTARIAQDDLTRRVYQRAAPAFEAAPRSAAEARLYPSIEMVRQRINAALIGLHAPQLPGFGPPQLAQGGERLSWRTCAAGLCLEGVTPNFGGGVYSYKVTVPAANAAGPAPAVAAQLATAGLEAPGAAHDLLAAPASASERRLAAADVCWTMAWSAQGDMTASASPGGCSA